MPEWIGEELVLIVLFGAIGLILGRCCLTLSKIARAGWRLSKLTAVDCAAPVVFATGLICLLYALYEPFQLTVTDVSIYSSKLPPSKSIEIAHITDLHCDGVKRNEDKIVSVLRTIKPDLIVFSGDASNNSAGLRDFRACMQALTQIAPVFGVAGNNDLRGEDVFAETSVKRLEGMASRLTVNGVDVWINGVGADKPALVEYAMSQAPPATFNIFLYHYPAAIKASSRSRIDLLCTGHTHGGQVRLPVYGAVVTNSDTGKQYEYGLYRKDNTFMFVSRGTGVNVLPVRFLSPPEIARIRVSGK